MPLTWADALPMIRRSTRARVETMNRGYGLAAVLVAVVVLVGTTACQDRVETRRTPAPVRLGGLYPMSGRSAPAGAAMITAAKVAVGDVNEAGGVLGRRVELVLEDDACDPGTAVGAAHKLTARAITVSVGGYCSSATVSTLKVFRSHEIPMIIPLANSTDLLAPRYDSVFLLSGTVTAEAAFALAGIRRLGGQRLAVVRDGTSFPAALAAAITAEAAATGVTVVASVELNQGASSYSRAATSVMGSGADTVYFTGYHAEARQLIIDLRAAGFQGRIVLGDGAVETTLLIGLTEAQSSELYGTSLPVPEFMPESSAWISHFQAVTGTTPGPNTLEAYDAVRLAVTAIRRAGSTDRGAVRQAIAAGTSQDTVTGPVRFNQDGTRVNPTFLLVKARNGGFALVAGSS